MRNFRVFILLLLLNIPLSIFAQDNLKSKKEVEEVLLELDSVIANKRHFQKMRQQHVDSLEQIVNSCHMDDYVEKCQELYRALSHFDGREALKVLKRIQKTEEYEQDPNLQAWVKLNASITYGIMGLYHSADNLTANIDPSVLSREEQLHYYLTSRYNYERIAEYMAEISIVQDEEKQMVALYDKIIELAPDGYEKDIVTANKAVYLNHPEEALEVLTEQFPKTQGMERCRMGMALAFANEELDNRQDYIYYLASTALCNLKSGYTTYEALPYLVHALYDEGDIDRAYTYLMCTMEDANTYPSRRLALGVSKYFPLINSSYRSHKAYLSHNEQMKRNSLIIIFTLMALALGIAFFLGWKQNKAAEERRRANQLQKALDQAEIADRIKTVFIQNMRHEIRTPLNAIMGFAQLMSNDLSDEERATYNGYIQESNNQLLSTLDDIIDVSHMETGAFNFQFEKFNVDELCLAHIESNKGMLTPDVKILYKPQEKDITLSSDKKRIGQVLDNLISNACKNTSSGTITLKVAHYIDRGKLQFVVTDTGTGVPPEKAEVIFEHFEKIDHYSPGLGLGLYVSRLIARALGGDIYLNTDYTEGAQFVFTVPNYIPPEEEKALIEEEMLEYEE
ncbi:MAG: HAMP domain-containing histidine kinase [Bacteroidaceae bacterium]|nr:HAMP domain-containing histidine kinase [Bacteroidaceae bacterium]